MPELEKVKHFRELIVWQRSMQLSVAVYELTRDFPREEIYGLTSQMRRAAVSILSNIAEGHGRSSRVQLAHFVSIAKGSNYELEAQLLLTCELQYGKEVDRQRCAALCDETGRMLHSMQRRLETPISAPTTITASH
jgi:four helix bundle protein